jgi:hypothetical protein
MCPYRSRDGCLRTNGRFAPEAAGQKRPLGEIKSKVVLKRWSSVRYRATRGEMAKVRRHRRPRECRGSSAAPTLQGKAFQFGHDFINDRITDLRQFERPPRLDRVSDRQHLQENKYDEFRG